MKKFLLVFILCFALIFCACSNQIDDMVFNNISDLRINYFYGKNNGVFAELSSGQREEQFFYDGISTQKVECGVLSVGFVEPIFDLAINAEIIIDNISKSIVLQHSPHEDLFMVDIGKKINNDANIKIVINKQIIELKNISNNWKVDYKSAINTAVKHFEDKIQNLYFNSKLNAEGYLKIISSQDFEKIFWYFSIIDRVGKRNSILIDVNSGEITRS